MNLETISTPTTEVFIESSSMSITLTRWANLEGVNVMALTKKELIPRLCGAFTWEELDALIIALSVARGM